MKTYNPFIPTVHLMTVPSRSHRDWFRAFVFSICGVVAALWLLWHLPGYRANSTMAASVPDQSAEATPEEPAKASLTQTSSDLSVAPVLAAVPGSEAVARNPVKEDSMGKTLPGDTIHTVKPGDTLSRIARSYGTTIRALKAANNLLSERLAVGTKLRIPEAKLLASVNS
ncbi:MAG TPA: LysM peptidoglycan-binding domain-containing protein [Clostridia bacterium]|nr:LysM peptidoglycan-binding domain-containing protein [Clostridia bacterium]